MSRGFARRVPAVAATVLVVLIASPVTRATAHAVFVAAEPAPGATLVVAPAAMRMVFSEPLAAGASGIDIYRSSGRPVPVLSAGIDARDSRAYEVRFTGLRPDRYSVVWHTVSAIDGHSRRGSYTFTVDRPDGSAPRVATHPLPALRPSTQVPTAGQAAGTWFALAGLFLLIGVVLVRLIARGTAVLEPAGSRRRLSWMAAAGAAGILAGTVAELVAAWAPAGWSVRSLGALVTSSAGRWWELRLAATLVLAWRMRSRVAPVAAGVAAYTFAATSHGAAAPHANVGLGFEFVHILAVSIWLGGAIAVAAIWAAARQAGDGDRRTLLRRYSIVAGAAVPAVIASGLGSAVVEVGRIGDLSSSSYGRSLVVKLAVVIALLAIAATNSMFLRPALDAGRPGGRRLDRTIAIEAAVGLAVLVPTAVLAVLAPSRAIDAARDTAARVQAANDPARAFSGSTRLAGRDAEIDVTPGAVGVNAARVEVAGRYRAARLRISVSGPGRPRVAVLSRSGYDHDPGTHTIYLGSLQLDDDGMWQARLQRAKRSGGGSAPVILPVTARPARTSPESGGRTSWLWLIALAGAAAGLGAATRGIPGHRVKAAGRLLGAVIAVIAVGWGATLAIGAAGQPAPAAGWGRTRTVSPDSTAGARVWRLPETAGVMMPAIAPDGSVWVSEMNANKLARLDPRGNLVQEFHFPGGYRESMAVAVAGDGRVWLAQERAMALGVFDPATGRYREFRIPGGVSAPVGLAVGRNGDVWFTEMSGNRIGRFDPATARFTQYPVPTADAAPYWLALGPDGRVWFTEFATGKVGVLDARTGRIREFAITGRPNLPALAIDHAGVVWVTSIQGDLYRLAPATGAVRPIGLSAPGEYGVAVAPDGEVWVGRDGGRSMFVVDPATAGIRSRSLPAGSAPWWPVVDSRGHIWVALAGRSGNGLARLAG